MTNDRRESLGRWLGSLLEAKTLVQIVAYVVTVIWFIASMNTRLNTVEIHQAMLENRYRDEVVPKNVLEKQNELLVFQISELTKQIQYMQSQLDSYGPNSYVYHPYRGAKPGSIKKY